VWEWVVHEYYAARLCHWAESESDRKATNKVKSWWKEWLTAADAEWTICSNERERSVNDLWSCKYANSPVTWSLLFVTNILAAFVGERDSNTVTTPSLEWVSTEGQQFLAWHFAQFMFRLVADIHFADIGSLYWQQQGRQTSCRIPKMSVNGASTVLAVAYLVIKASRGCSRA